MDDFVVVVICQALREMSKFTLFDKHQVQKELGEESVYFMFSGHSSPLREVRVGIQAKAW